MDIIKTHRSYELSQLVTVVITTYGDCSTLSRAIDSVLAQSYGNIEIIVVDDNGKDSDWRLKTEILMTGYASNDRIKYVCHEYNMNGSAARNTGIIRASGEFITFLDNDDIMLSSRIENAVYALADSRYDAVFCDVLIIFGGCYSGVVSSKSGLSWKNLLLDSNCMGTGSNLFMRRSSIDETGMFDVEFRRNQDVEYMLRFLLQHKSIWINGIGLLKCDDATCNIQNLDSYMETKKYFDDVFREEISLLDEEEEHTRILSRNREFLALATRDGDIECCNQYFSSLKELGHPLSKARKMFTLAECKRMPLAVFIRNLHMKVRHYAICRSLDAETKAEIKRLLV